MGGTRVYVYGLLHRSGFGEGLKVSICYAMILLTCAIILKTFVLAHFVGLNPRERNGLWFSWFFAKIWPTKIENFILLPQILTAFGYHSVYLHII